MNALIQEIVRHLDQIAGVEVLWRRGAVHPGGPHYRLRNSVGPISIGEDECRVFGKLIETLQPQCCFIIGNAFGFSSAFIAKTMERHGGQSVVTLDNQSEGHGAHCAKIAQKLADRVNCKLLLNQKGTSPDDIPEAAGDNRYDLIFLDGLHRHPQVTRDFLGSLPIATPNAVFAWHDYWMPGIPESVAEAQSAGFQCLKINSSCEMVLGTQDPNLFRRIESLFPTGEPPRKRLRPGAFLKVCTAVVTGTVRSRLAKTP